MYGTWKYGSSVPDWSLGGSVICEYMYYTYLRIENKSIMGDRLLICYYIYIFLHFKWCFKTGINNTYYLPDMKCICV